MTNIVACTLTVIKTDISCVIRIYRAQQHTPLWEKIGGRLELKPKNAWAYVKGIWGFVNLEGNSTGVALLPDGCNTSSSSMCSEAQWLALLRGVPKDFFNLVSDQRSLSGEGELFLTREKVRWAMWFRSS